MANRAVFLGLFVASAAATAGCIPIIITCPPAYPPPGVTEVDVMQWPWGPDRLVRVTDPYEVARILSLLSAQPHPCATAGTPQYHLVLIGTSGRMLDSYTVYGGPTCIPLPAPDRPDVSPEFRAYLNALFPPYRPRPVPEGARYETVPGY